jgi:hypothetical protein
MAELTPAEELRAAAAKLRKHGSEATPCRDQAIDWEKFRRSAAEALWDEAIAISEAKPPHPDRAYVMDDADWAEFRRIAAGYDREAS